MLALQVKNLNSTSHGCYSTVPSIGCWEIMKVLVNYGWDPLETSESGKTMLRVLVTRGVVSVTQYLLSFGVSPSLDLLHAASNGPEKSSMVVCLVKNGANVHALTASGDPVLQTALQSFGFGEWNDGRALETTRVLVNHGCDPLEASPSGDTALHIAIERGFLSVARFLFSLGISPSPDLLHIALERGHTSTIVCLLESGTNVHARTAAGDSVLHIALQSISEEEYTLRIAKILVCHGCNLLEASSSGETALDIAVRRGFVSVVRYITSLQVGIVPSCNLVLVAFKLGSRNKPKRIPMLRSLLDGGANVHARTATGRSVLHIALRTFRNEKNCFEGRENPHLWWLQSSKPVPQEKLRSTLQSNVDLALLYNTSSLSACPPPSDLLHTRTATRDPILHIALQASQDDNHALETAKVLFGHGCNILECDSHGKTPFASL